MQFLQELLVENAPLHSFPSDDPCTPFLDLLRGYLTGFDSDWFFILGESSIRSQIEKLPSILHLWLECLQRQGHSLEDYGRKEVELHHQKLVSWQWHIPDDVTRMFRLTQISYGPLLDDWKFGMGIALVQAAEQSLKMPGSWEEDDGDDMQEQASSADEGNHDDRIREHFSSESDDDVDDKMSKPTPEREEQDDSPVQEPLSSEDEDDHDDKTQRHWPFENEKNDGVEKYFVCEFECTVSAITEIKWWSRL